MPSLTHELISTYVEEIPEEKFTGLLGSNVIVEGSHPMISRIVSTNGRFLRWKYRYHLDGSKATHYEGPAVYSGEMNFLAKDSKKARIGPTEIEYREVFGYFPSVVVPGWGRFDPDDTELGRVLGKGLAKFPSVKTKDDVTALTEWVHGTFPYQEPLVNVRFIKGRRNFVSLGSQMTDETVCAQLALIELGILRLQGVKATPMEILLNPTDTDIRSHAVLSVKLPQPKEPKLCVDPTSGTVLDLDYARHLYQETGASMEKPKLILA